MRVGVTGHQRLQNTADWQEVAKQIRHVLSQMPTPLIAVTSLAIGADQLLARISLDMGGSIHAVLPFADIERTFSENDLPSYLELAECSDIEVLEGSSSDEDAFLAAGQRVVDLSDVVVAVWDGHKAKGSGGTADIVEYAERKGVPIVRITPASQNC